jgi:hypothetical protein
VNYVIVDGSCVTLSAEEACAACPGACTGAACFVEEPCAGGGCGYDYSPGDCPAPLMPMMMMPTSNENTIYLCDD